MSYRHCLQVETRDNHTILGTLNLSNIFEVVLSREDVKQPKLDPEIFLAAAEKPSAGPESCVVIDDSRPGIEAARRAGLGVIAIRSDFSPKSDFCEADLVLNNARELNTNYIANLLLGGALLNKRRRKAAGAAREQTTL